MTTVSALGLLPEWNLADLYAAPDAPAFKDDMQKGETKAKASASPDPERPASLPL